VVDGREAKLSTLGRVEQISRCVLKPELVKESGHRFRGKLGEATTHLVDEASIDLTSGEKENFWA